MPLRLHLLPWDRPFLPQAVEFLSEGWSGGRPLDLSDTMVVVPTRQSGRRLREALAAWAALRGQAVFPPQVVLPAGVASGAAAGAATASRMEALLAWTSVFRELDLESFREIFPVDPPARTFAWALRLAGQFAHLKATLAEAGLGLADVAARAGGDFEEAGRWREIAELGRRQGELLAAAGLRDAQDLRIAAAPAPPTGVRRIVVLATPDPMPQALAVLGAHAGVLPVDVVVFGPPGGEALFDAWGRPLPEVWSARDLEMESFEERVHLCADPAAQAARVAAHARGAGVAEGLLAVGAADSEVHPFLENAFSRAGIPTFNPEGRMRRCEGFFVLLEALAAAGCERTFDAAAALGRCPPVLAWLSVAARAAGEPFSPARFLSGLDELRGRHLPAALEVARRHAAGLARSHPELPAALERLEALEKTLVSGGFPAGPAAALGAIFGGRWCDLGRDEDAQLVEIAEAWRGVLREAEAAAPLARGLDAADWWEVVLQLFGDERRFDEKPAGALEIQGWLELLWEDAPHLVVAGMNDGRVPEAVVGDAFLPEALRERLGLKSNAARFARDAYLLQALAASRARGGRLDLVLGKASAAGDPLRPSRLLFRCPDAALPGRVEFLFRAPPAARAATPWRRAWRLKLREAPTPAELPVTAFRDYLRCPFRFRLKRVLRMEAVDAEKSELDAMDFGNLCHGALEAMGREPALRDCADAKTLREFLLGEAERLMRARYGSKLALPLVVQLESARQRLARAAEVQARERGEGWVIDRVEWAFPEAPPLAAGGMRIRGKIDRIERNERTGAWRILDYKTSDTAKDPCAAHCEMSRKGNAAAPAFARFNVDGIERVWTDLQLPLYLEAFALSGGAAAPGTVACGYFDLPKAVGETGVRLWEGYSGAWQKAALRCAAAIGEAVAAGRFWPPAEAVPNDSFAPLLLRGAAESVAPEASGGEGAP